MTSAIAVLAIFRNFLARRELLNIFPMTRVARDIGRDRRSERVRVRTNSHKRETPKFSYPRSADKISPSATFYLGILLCIRSRAKRAAASLPRGKRMKILSRRADDRRRPRWVPCVVLKSSSGYGNEGGRRGETNSYLRREIASREDKREGGKDGGRVLHQRSPRNFWESRRVADSVREQRSLSRS